MTFSAGTMAESGTQARALIRHLMMMKKRFAVVSIAEPQGATYAVQICSDLAKQYGYHYGTDWISFGYQLQTPVFYKSFAHDIPAAIGADGVESKPVASFPIMKGIHNANDLAMFIDVTASDSVWYWVQLVQPATQPRLKIGYACTGIGISEAYPYLDSGQIVGMMPGLKGGADYETLVDNLQLKEYRAGRVARPTFDYAAPVSLKLPMAGRKLMFVEGPAHLTIILFILFGNIGMLVARARARKAGKEKA